MQTETKDLVVMGTINGNQVLVTDSLKVAEVFGEQHKDVIRAIGNLEMSPEFNRRNFALVGYLQQGKPRKMYHMTKDGTAWLIHGFTGGNAAELYEFFISEFNRMQQNVSESIREANVQGLDYDYNKVLPRSLFSLKKVSTLLQTSCSAEELAMALSRAKLLDSDGNFVDSMVDTRLAHGGFLTLKGVAAILEIDHYLNFSSENDPCAKGLIEFDDAVEQLNTTYKDLLSFLVSRHRGVCINELGLLSADLVRTGKCVVYGIPEYAEPFGRIRMQSFITRKGFEYLKSVIAEEEERRAREAEEFENIPSFTI